MNILIIFKLIFFCSLVSCYEGWEYDQGQVPDEDIPTPQTKPVHYILISAISPTSDAFSNPTCGLNPSHEEYRFTEWNSRIGLMQSALEDIADTVVLKPINITSDDCENMTPVNLVSIDPQPWGSSQEPTQDPLGRKIIHVRAVFWDGDSSSLSAITNYGPWAGWKNLYSFGHNVDSVSYFIQSNPENGYFGDWKTRSSSITEEHSILIGTNIDQPNPTPSGVNGRNNIIEQDTSELVQHILSL